MKHLLVAYFLSNILSKIVTCVKVIVGRRRDVCVRLEAAGFIRTLVDSLYGRRQACVRKPPPVSEVAKRSPISATAEHLLFTRPVKQQSLQAVSGRTNKNLRGSGFFTDRTPSLEPSVFVEMEIVSVTCDVWLRQSPTRHRASTSMYSLTFCVRFLLPERHQWKPTVQTAAVMLRTPSSSASQRPAARADPAQPAVCTMSSYCGMDASL